MFTESLQKVSFPKKIIKNGKSDRSNQKIRHTIYDEKWKMSRKEFLYERDKAEDPRCNPGSGRGLDIDPGSICVNR